MRKKFGWGFALPIVAALISAVSCADGDGSHIGGSSAALSVLPHFDTAPSISDFVVYADRSVTLGTSDGTLLGDIGVRTATTAGAQLRVGAADHLSASSSLLAPSVSLGRLSTVGVVQTSALTNNGGLLVAQAGFPAGAMPSLPVAPTATPGAANVTVGAFQITTLSPGNYGALNVTGTALLNPGTYSFSSVTLANNAHLFANIGGTTRIRIAGALHVGSSSQVSPVLPQPAGNLQIFVSGASATVGVGSTLTALLTVPSGSLALSDNVVAIGAFAARDFSAGNHVTLGYQTGFAPAASADIPCSLSLRAQFPLPPLVPIQGVATPVAPLTFFVPAQIPVTSGSPAAGAALLTFVPPRGLPVTCTYGALGIPATAFGLQGCSNGAAAESVQVAQSLTLTPVGSFNLSLGAVTLSAALGAPSSVCDDHNLCTTDSCGSNGLCQNATVQCQPSDTAHAAGTCTPSTGVCTNPIARPYSPKIPDPLPAPPAQAGCYVGTLGGWLKIQCASGQDVIQHFGHPEVSNYGIQAGNPNPAPPLVFGQVETTLTSVASAASGASSNQWSIQNNTNFYSCNGAGGSAVTDSCVNQFVIQTDAVNGYSAICIWNIDGTTQVYDTTCVGVTGQNNLFTGQNILVADSRVGGLRAFDFANVAGSTFTDNSVNPPVKMLSLVAQYSWVSNNDTPAAQTSEPHQLPGLYAVVTPDQFGLTGAWTDVTGGILGEGGGSQEVFGNAEVMTRVMASTCPGDVSASGPTCPGTALSTSNVSVQSSTPTVETDNLTLIQAPSLSFPNQNLVVTEMLASTNVPVASTNGTCLAGQGDHAFLKDNDGDNGGTPSNSGGVPFWESPDIFVLPHGAPAPTVTDTSADFELSSGVQYDVYLRVNNDYGCNSVNGVKLLIEGADPNMGFANWSDVTLNAGNGQYLTDPNATTVPAFGRAILGPFTWTPPGNGGHKCLLAAVFAGTEVPPAFPLAPAYSSNQIGQRNLEFSNGSTCAYTISNSSTSSVNLLLGVSTTPATPPPGSAGGPTVTLTFSDPSSLFYNAWNAQSGLTASNVGGQTTVTLNTSNIALNSVAIPAGQAPTITIAVTAGSGGGPAPSVALSSQLTDGVGSIVVQNGGTCQSTGPLVAPCTGGQTRCGAACVSLASDGANCGACGHVCAATETCTGSICIPTVVK